MNRPSGRRSMPAVRPSGRSASISSRIFSPIAPIAARPSGCGGPNSAQPALFVVEYALARLMLRWGIRSAALVGHSIGEYVGACPAGVMTRDDALRIEAERGRLMQSPPAGAMLSVRAGEAEVAPYLRPGISVAAVNAPDLSVLSGPTETVAEIARALEQAGLLCRPLNTSHAFHSAMTEPILEAFRATMRTATLRRPQLPYISNPTGTWITPGQATDPDYYAAYLRQPVRFADGLAALAQAGHGLFLGARPRHDADHAGAPAGRADAAGRRGDAPQPAETGIRADPRAGRGGDAADAGHRPRLGRAPRHRDRPAHRRCRPIRSSAPATGRRRRARPAGATAVLPAAPRRGRPKPRPASSR